MLRLIDLPVVAWDICSYCSSPLGLMQQTLVLSFELVAATSENSSLAAVVFVVADAAVVASVLQQLLVLQLANLNLCENVFAFVPVEVVAVASAALLVVGNAADLSTSPSAFAALTVLALVLSLLTVLLLMWVIVYPCLKLGNLEKL